jgi:hypothetical protein
MSQIVVFGDVHLSDSRPWSEQVGNSFLEWFKNLEYNNENNTAIFTGDVAENFLSSGIVYDQMFMLFSTNNRFKKTYVVVGNHDIKKKGRKEHVTYKFVRNIKGLEIIEAPPATIKEIDGHRVLFLPHYNPRSVFPPMHEYYSNLPEEYHEKPFDIVVGHVADDSARVYGKTCLLSRIKTRYFALGHIHVRISQHYLGSIFPNNSKENDRTRCLKVFSRDQEHFYEESVKLPIFCEYYDVEFPNELPEVPAIHPIWTIYNCSSEEMARRLYGDDIYIRKCISSKYEAFKSNAELLKGINSTEFKFLNLRDKNTFLNEFIKTRVPPLSREVAKELRSLI